jgi:regulator of nucleoside diphosphate kinase
MERAMTRLPPCRLSVRDFHVLEQLFDSDITDPVFYRMLRAKIAGAAVIAHSVIDCDVTKIGSRVDFIIDDQLCESLVLTADPGTRPSRLTLPVTTLRGLALLGLKGGDELTLEMPDGRRERLRLTKVYQAHDDNVLPLHRAAPRGWSPGDDDPGPRAA